MRSARFFGLTALALTAILALEGCANSASQISQGVAPKKRAAFFRVLNVTSHDIDVKLDGRTIGPISPSASKPYQAISPAKRHKLEVSGGATKFNQDVTLDSNQTETMIVSDAATPTLVSGENHTPVTGKVTVQALSLGPAAALSINGTDIPVATGTTLGNAVALDAGDAKWKSGSGQGDIKLTADHCITVIFGPKGGPAWIDFEIPKPVSMGNSGAG